MQPLKVTVVPVTPFQQNCSIVACTATNRAAIVDPGGDVARIRDGDRSAQGHAGEDPAHARPYRSCGRRGRACRGAVDCRSRGRTSATASCSRTSRRRARASASRTCATSRRRAGWSKARRSAIGDLTFNVLHVPGHTPGHLVFVNVPARFALVGDTLFQGSVGRTDFAYGNSRAADRPASRRSCCRSATT